MDRSKSAECANFSGSHRANALYQGTTLVVPPKNGRMLGFTGCGKTEFFEGDGLQAVRKRLKTDPALAAEGTAFASYSTFFRSLFSPWGTFFIPFPQKPFIFPQP
jgi:hypothetical protein